MGTSRSFPVFISKGTENLVPVTIYSVFCVIKGDECAPPLFGISSISTVSNFLRSILAILGVLFSFMNTHLPSGTPSVCESWG